MEGLSIEDVRDALEEKIQLQQEVINRTGDEVRSLKANLKASGDQSIKALVDAKIAELVGVKATMEALLKEHAAVGGGGLASREAFRERVNNLLERRHFFIPAFKIYGGVAGLFDYGPPGCGVKSNVLSLWREHFVMKENMLEIDCVCVTPEVVLKASGHVDKFTDLMVKDVKTLAPYRADHLLKAALEQILDDPMVPKDAKVKAKHDEALVDEFSAEELGAKLTEYKVKAPETGNDITEPFPFNLMFETKIGPTGTLTGYMRPETAQGIFVNFNDLLYANGGKLPFAGAQIGQAFRNEISPKAGLLRVREFTLAEIEHFVHPDRKAHPRFSQVSHLVLNMYSRGAQMGDEKKPLVMTIGDAVAQGIVNNETLGYFIARTYQFLMRVGIKADKLRFRQHLAHEMAHYACDCWDAEIECSYGWVECVGHADRSCFDLKAHTAMSKVPLEAFDTYKEARTVERVEVVPNKKIIGKQFKRDGQLIIEYLVQLEKSEALALKDSLATGTCAVKPCDQDQTFDLTAEMVSIETVQRKVNGEAVVPSVIEPSFGIGRIIYCLYEHSFYIREGGDEARAVLAFPPSIAPLKCSVFPLVANGGFESICDEILDDLLESGIAAKLDTTGVSIGKRYARTDEIGVPFAITVDHITLAEKTVTLRERDSQEQIRIGCSDVVATVGGLCSGRVTWSEMKGRFPHV